MSFHCGSVALRNSRVRLPPVYIWNLISADSNLLKSHVCHLISFYSYFCWWKSVGVQFSLTKLSQVDFIFSRHEGPNKAGVLEAMQRGVTAGCFYWGVWSQWWSTKTANPCKSTNAVFDRSKSIGRLSRLHENNNQVNASAKSSYQHTFGTCLVTVEVFARPTALRTIRRYTNCGHLFINLVSENRAGTLYKGPFFVSIRSFLLWLHKKMLSQKTSSQPGELVCHWEKCHFSHLRFPPSPLNFPRCNTYPWPPTIGPTSSRPGRTKRSSAQPGLGWHWGSAYKPEDQWHLVGMGQISRYAWTHLFFAVLCIQLPTPNYSNMRTVRTLGLYGYRWSIKFCQQMEDTQTAISTGRWSWLRFPAELTDTSVTISQL